MRMHICRPPALPAVRLQPPFRRQPLRVALRPAPRQQSSVKIVSLFTGIVQGKAQVVQLTRKDNAASFRIQFPAGALASIQIGASVSVNGTCLTVVDAEGDQAAFDVIGETLSRTNLGRLEEGSEVNFERSAKVGDEIGGHNVSGHVCSTALISSLEETDNNRRLVFQVQEPWIQYILPKGFVGVEGISLTVGEVGPDWFSVYLIPETLRVTTLGGKQEGDYVNIEVDAQTQAIVEAAQRVVERLITEGRLKNVST